MAKNNQKSEGRNVGVAFGGGGGSQSKVFAVLKFIFFILLLPLVFGCTVGFIDELKALPKDVVDYFVRGIIFYLILHLFIYKPQGIYQYGQNLVSITFQFFSPLVKVATFLLPIYSFIFLIIFYILNLVHYSAAMEHCMIFMVSFSLTMHMVFTAEVLGGKSGNLLNPHYFFAISLIYVVNAFIFALLLALILPDFSFPNFFETASSIVAHTYKVVFYQLFVPYK